ncbi:unnamed protein product [Closterium sp. NIES-54]
MPLRLTNTPATFQITLNEAFRPLLDKCVILYLDDILVHSRDKQQHLADLEALFKVFDEHRPLTKEFYGLCLLYASFVPDMALLIAPLTDLLQKGVAFTWGEKELDAFSALKKVMCSPPVLRIADPYCPFEEVIDASNIAIGAALLHVFSDGLQSVAYKSRKLHPHKKNYPIHDREMLPIVHALKLWSCYLTGADVTVQTDH